MLTFEKEKAADQMFGRTQWWRSGPVTFLVRFDRDEKRCGIYMSGNRAMPSAEALFNKLGLGGETDITLEPGIDCYAIGCPSDRLRPILEKLASAVA